MNGLDVGARVSHSVHPPPGVECDLLLLESLEIPSTALPSSPPESYLRSGASGESSIGVFYIDPEIREHLARKEEGRLSGSQIIRIHRLLRQSLDMPILMRLGAQCALTFEHIAFLLQRQRKGERGKLSTYGGVNVAYVELCGLLSSVSIRWVPEGDGWAFEALSVDHPLQWPAGTQILSG